MITRLRFLSILTRFYTREILINRYFLLMLMTGLSFMVLGTSGVFEKFGLTAYPVTYMVLETLNGNFNLFLLIMITFFSGELIWKEREAELTQLYAVLPLGIGVQVLARFVAILLMIALIFLVLFVTGVIIQLSSGSVAIDIGLYARGLAGIEFSYYVLMTVLVFLVHGLINHKYQAHALLIVFFFLRATILPRLGFDHNLYLYAMDPGMIYSDFFGFGYHQEAFLWFRAYWLILAMILAVITYLFWPVGIEDTFWSRMRRARVRLTQRQRVLLVAGVCLFALTGSYIFYNTNVLNDYKAISDVYSKEAAYEQKYKKFKSIAQPDISNASLNVELFAASRDMQVGGYYYLKNNTDIAIDSLHIQIPDNTIIYQTSLRLQESFQVELLEIDQPHTVVLEDKVHNYYILELERPLQPDDSVKLSFSLAYLTEGFSNKGNPHLDVLNNGTLFYPMYWPRVGYNEDMELNGDLRKQYGLEPSDPMPKAGDQNTIQTQPIYCNLIVGSDEGHITVASGERIAGYKESNRNYVEFKSRSLPGFLSGKYEESKFLTEGIEVSMLYLKGHGYNLDQFQIAITNAVTYCTRQFGELPLKKLSFVEYPRYAEHAVAFPGLIAYPELGFIENYERDADFDRLSRVTAHEVAHQWWGGQLESDPVQGSTMLSETMAEYISLMSLKEYKPEDQIAKHLKSSQQAYLRLRGAESNKEVPLLYVQGQNYLHYNKGASVFYALQDYLGEKRLNEILRSYYENYLEKEIRSAHSLELYDYIKRGIPDSLHMVVTDLLERITLYELKTLEAEFVQIADEKFELELTVEVHKLYADGLGNEVEGDLNEWMDIGVFSENDSLIYLKKHYINKRKTLIKVQLPQTPFSAGIDPRGILIDKHPKDNVRPVSKAKTRNIP